VRATACVRWAVSLDHSKLGTAQTRAPAGLQERHARQLSPAVVVPAPALAEMRTCQLPPAVVVPALALAEMRTCQLSPAVAPARPEAG
jgi:hypothetical protein